MNNHKPNKLEGNVAEKKDVGGGNAPTNIFFQSLFSITLG